ncbi:MAG: DNA/RNA nuclease SfsA [Gammaproteobacteria bacterium]|nr:DNA/RNA nuclease SfsA [Gammaproteobacteria bacterium]
MIFDPPLESAELLRRYQRFMAEVYLPWGEKAVLHCPNTGAMTGCCTLGSRVWFSDSRNPKRKYPLTWEIVEVDGGCLVGVNTHRANALVREGIENGAIAELQGYDRIRREVRYGAGERRSRIDLLLEREGERCFVEVKSVTLGREDGLGQFPDAVTSRGTRHLRELMAVAAAGDRAVLLFCVQHTGIDRVAPADHVDPVYGRTLREAAAAGVEIIAYGAAVSPEAIRVAGRLPVLL